MSKATKRNRTHKGDDILVPPKSSKELQDDMKINSMDFDPSEDQSVTQRLVKMYSLKQMQTALGTDGASSLIGEISDVLRRSGVSLPTLSKVKDVIAFNQRLTDQLLNNDNVLADVISRYNEYTRTKEEKKVYKDLNTDKKKYRGYLNSKLTVQDYNEAIDQYDDDKYQEYDKFNTGRLMREKKVKDILALGERATKADKANLSVLSKKSKPVYVRYPKGVSDNTDAKNLLITGAGESGMCIPQTQAMHLRLYYDAEPFKADMIASEMVRCADRMAEIAMYER